MINLLPELQKNEIRAGRTNILLLRYISLMFASILLISALIAGIYYTLNVSASTANKRVADNILRTGTYAQTKAAADSFRSDLATAKLILDKDVRYSQLIYKISNALPSGVILDSLTVDSQTLGTSVTISARASSIASALQLKSSFESRTDLFSDVHFEAITEDKDTASSYKYQTSLNVIINKDSL